jgi:putative intracellular protease/amidase
MIMPDGDARIMTFQKQAFILLAAGFDAASIIFTLDQLRQASFDVRLISLQRGLVQSSHGLWVKPDDSLETADLSGLPQLVILPDGEQCATMLLRDPRVHRLLKRVVAQQGVVAALPASELWLHRLSAMHDIPLNQFVGKPPGNGSGQGMALFAEQLVARLAV